MSIAICSATIAVRQQHLQHRHDDRGNGLAPGGLERIRPVRRQCANGRYQRVTRGGVILRTRAPVDVLRAELAQRPRLSASASASSAAPSCRPEQAFERRIELEQPPIKERRRIVGNRRDGREAVLNERFLGQRQH